MKKTDFREVPWVSEYPETCSLLGISLLSTVMTAVSLMVFRSQLLTTKLTSDTKEEECEKKMGVKNSMHAKWPISLNPNFDLSNKYRPSWAMVSVFVIKVLEMRGRNSSVVSSVPTILQPQVRIPSPPSKLFSICIIKIVSRKWQNEQKEAGIGPFLKSSWNHALSKGYLLTDSLQF